jgi:hypothetical protein
MGVQRKQLGQLRPGDTSPVSIYSPPLGVLAEVKMCYRQQHGGRHDLQPVPRRRRGRVRPVDRARQRRPDQGQFHRPDRGRFFV